MGVPIVLKIHCLMRCIKNLPGSSKVILTLNVYGSSNQMPYSQFIFKTCELYLLLLSEFTSQELLVLLIIF